MVVYAFLSKIYKTPFPYHLVVWIYSQKLLNNDGTLFKYRWDPERDAIQAGFLSCQEMLFLEARVGLHPAQSCPAAQADALPSALGPELNGHTEVLYKTHTRMLFSVGFRQCKKFPKSWSIIMSVRGHTSGNLHYFTSWLRKKKSVSFWSMQENPLLG